MGPPSVILDEQRETFFDNVTMPTMGAVELSLCGSHMGTSMQDNKDAFEKYRVSFEDLCRKPGLVFDNRLIVLSQGRLYPCRVALPLLMSYMAFLKPLDTEALWKLATEETYRHVHFRRQGQESDIETDNETLEELNSNQRTFSFSPPLR